MRRRSGAIVTVTDLENGLRRSVKTVDQGVSTFRSSNRATR